ncbi:MAG: hypothetical protein VB023_00015 [Oscillibacter sp.]|nr:hypothetical protein [Oscillibacter sp.]
MLFRKHMEPRCAYCKKGSVISETEVACVKRGVVAPWDACPSFRYDPLKRMPPRPEKLDTSTLKKEDFSL